MYYVRWIGKQMRHLSQYHRQLTMTMKTHQSLEHRFEMKPAANGGKRRKKDSYETTTTILKLIIIIKCVYHVHLRSCPHTNNIYLNTQWGGSCLFLFNEREKSNSEKKNRKFHCNICRIKLVMQFFFSLSLTFLCFVFVENMKQMVFFFVAFFHMYVHQSFLSELSPCYFGWFICFIDDTLSQ